jgi:hypothetical protein
MSRATSFESLVAQIQSLPVSHRKAAFALALNDIAESFKALAEDVAQAAKSALAKAAQPEKKMLKCRRTDLGPRSERDGRAER